MWDRTYVDTLSEEAVREYAACLEYLDEGREELLEALPDCPAHGSGCIPYAVAWIEKAVAAGVALEDDEIPRMTPEQHAEVSGAIAGAIAKIASR